MFSINWYVLFYFKSHTNAAGLKWISLTEGTFPRDFTFNAEFTLIGPDITLA